MQRHPVQSRKRPQEDEQHNSYYQGFSAKRLRSRGVSEAEEAVIVDGVGFGIAVDGVDLDEMSTGQLVLVCISLSKALSADAEFSRYDPHLKNKALKLALASLSL